jgi:hypothetical protein
MPATSPGAKPTSSLCGTVRQRAAYSWFRVELANLRTALRWAADRGDLDVAATIAGDPLAVLDYVTLAIRNFHDAGNTTIIRMPLAIAHLREVLGNPAYETLAHDGELMTTAAMATYAYDQIDQSRAGLNQPG